MSETPLTCARCGAAVDAGHDFCPKCGTALRAQAPPLPAGPPPLPRKPFPVVAVAAAAGAVVLLLAVAAFFALPKRSGDGASARFSWGSDGPSVEVSGGSGGKAEGSGGDILGEFLGDHPLSGTFHCRKGAEFDVDPEDAVVAINEVVIGKADDFDGKGGGRTYYFKGPGTYIARFTMKGYRTAWVKMVVSPDAAESVVSVDTELRER